MIPTAQQVWQEAYNRLMLVDIEEPISEQTVDLFLAGLPKRLETENYSAWLKRGKKLAKIVAFPTLKFSYLTDVQRLAADTRKKNDALPEKSLLSSNKQFRITVTELSENKVKLTVEALGLASSRYAHKLIGISAENNKDDLITVLHLDEDGEGIDDSLENTQTLRQALLRPVISLIEQGDA
jgi:hypothetical protein